MNNKDKGKKKKENTLKKGTQRDKESKTVEEFIDMSYKIGYFKNNPTAHLQDFLSFLSQVIAEELESNQEYINFKKEYDREKEAEAEYYNYKISNHNPFEDYLKLDETAGSNNKEKSKPEKAIQGKDDEFDFEFDLLPVNMSDVLKLPIDDLLDLYNDYKTLYEITKDSLFETRAKVYLSCLKVKQKIEERRRNEK